MRSCSNGLFVTSVGHVHTTTGNRHVQRGSGAGGVAKADEYTTAEAANDTTCVDQRSTSLTTGDVLNRENWQLAEGLLPPEMLKHYRDGDFENRILE